LFLTALGDKQHLIAGLQAGADDYLIKPFDIEDLAARFLVAQRIIHLETERLELLRTEQALRMQAEQAVHVRDEVLATVSHDLMAPVTAIKATAQLLQRRIASTSLPGDKLLEGLERIAHVATQMSGSIEDLLDATQLAMGQSLHLRCEPTDLVTLARQAAEDRQRGTERHSFRVQSTLETLVGQWDAARLRRVLDNLLDNAVKYSPAGGDVTVGLERMEREGQTLAVLLVRDQGVGIPAEDQVRVFERFHRGANVGRIAGTGIGLAGTREIVEQHGGSIEMQSGEGAGSTFTIRLPLDSTVRDKSEPGGDGTGGVLAGGRI
jgi:signal transduction histidine kinase